MGHIVIKVKLKSKFGQQKVEGKSIVKEGVSLTVYTDPRITKSSFAAMKKAGKDCELREGTIIERYKDMTREQIADKIEQDLQHLRARFRKIMIIRHTREVVR